MANDRTPADPGDVDPYDLEDEGGNPTPRADRRRDDAGRFAEEHDPAMVEVAQSYGLSDATIGTLSRAQLAGAIRDMRKREAAEHARRVRDDARDARPAPVVQPRTPEPPADDALPFRTDDIDPDIVKFLKETRAELRETKRRLAESDEQTRQSQARQIHDVLDDAFASLADHAHLFGDEAGSELQPTDPKMRRRVAVINAAGIDFAKDGPRAIRRKIAQAVKDVYPEGTGRKVAPAAPQNPYAAAGADVPDEDRVSPEDWRAAQVERPTRRTPPAEKPGERKATRTAARKMKEMGFSDDEYGDDEKNGFLG